MGEQQPVFTYSLEPPAVVERTCARRVDGKGFYPDRDSAGDAMYDNTHFATYDEALDRLRREVVAGIEMATRDRARLRSELDRKTVELADHAEDLVVVNALLDARARGASE